MGGVKTARQAAKDSDLENLAYEMRAYAEGLHGCSIGFRPWAPCTCAPGQLAQRLWLILHPRANLEDPGCGVGECQRAGKHVPSCPLWRRNIAESGKKWPEVIDDHPETDYP